MLQQSLYRLFTVWWKCYNTLQIQQHPNEVLHLCKCEQRREAVCSRPFILVVVGGGTFFLCAQSYQACFLSTPHICAWFQMPMRVSALRWWNKAYLSGPISWINTGPGIGQCLGCTPFSCIPLYFFFPEDGVVCIGRHGLFRVLIELITILVHSVFIHRF